jgi:hypothetical protein
MRALQVTFTQIPSDQPSSLAHTKSAQQQMHGLLASVLLSWLTLLGRPPPLKTTGPGRLMCQAWAQTGS